MLKYIVYLIASALIFWSFRFVLKEIIRQCKGIRGCGGGCGNCTKNCQDREKTE